MEIQTVFYTLASMFMVMGIVLLFTVFVLLWRLEKSVTLFKKKTVVQMNRFVEQKKLVGIISALGLGLKWIADRKKRQNRES